jgi:hypothetical protein
LKGFWFAELNLSYAAHLEVLNPWWPSVNVDTKPVEDDYDDVIWGSLAHPRKVRYYSLKGPSHQFESGYKWYGWIENNH